MRLRLLGLVLLVGHGCEGGTTLGSPTVRIDLRAKLPPAVGRRQHLNDTSYECRRTFTLEAGGARQRFVASYRVFEDKQGKFVTGVELDPDGATEGAHTPHASAVLLEIVNRGSAERVLAVAPLRVSWGATKGCTKLNASTVVELAADAPDCKPPAPKLKLLTPVP